MFAGGLGVRDGADVLSDFGQGKLQLLSERKTRVWQRSSPIFGLKRKKYSVQLVVYLQEYQRWECRDQSNLPGPADDVTLVLLVLGQLTLQLHLALVPDQLLFILTLGAARTRSDFTTARATHFPRFQ